MAKSVKEDKAENFRECAKIYGTKTLHSLLSAFLIWLFGVLVFIPLASSLNRQTEVFCTLIFFVAFTLLILRAFPGLKKIIDAFSLFPARKYSVKKGLSHENSVVLFRHLFYIILIAIFYLLYFPFLANFHPSISGIVLILALIWIFFLIMRIFPVFSAKIFEWLGSKE